MTNQNQISARWPEVVGLAWADDEFRRQLMSEPERQLEAMGIAVNGSGRIRILEESEGETILVMPRRPEGLGTIAGSWNGLDRGTSSTCEKGTLSTCDKATYSTCDKGTYSTCEKAS